VWWDHTQRLARPGIRLLATHLHAFNEPRPWHTIRRSSIELNACTQYANPGGQKHEVLLKQIYGCFYMVKLLDGSSRQDNEKHV
jgi:hypothetical protein